ncbi:MAG: hypothetical protein JSV62_12180 [Promethearchaeota archaeon]|nr:MAG: hypothetical protein JSV62_12180 [Candidatus Lokiarchaeota archaeon]
MSHEKYFVGIDVGTSYVKSVLINNSKEILSTFVKKTGTSIENSSKTAYQTILSDV